MVLRRPAKLAFYKGKGTFFDKLVRFIKRSKYSHVELIVNNEWYSCSNREGCVRKKIVETTDKDNWDFVDIGVAPGSVQNFFIKTKGQENSKRISIFGNIFGIPAKKWNSTLWCSQASGLLKPEEPEFYNIQKFYERVSNNS